MNPTQRPCEHSTRTEIDMAIGVLIALRGCSRQHAFRQIAEAAHRAGVGLGSASQALVTLASGRPDPAADPEVLRHWQSVLGQCPGATT